MGRRYDPEECSGCLFQCSEGTCDFMVVTGRARSGICPPGDGCTVRAETERAYYARCREYRTGAIPPPPGNRTVGRKGRLPFDESRAWQLYSKERMNDREIADVLGVTPPVIYRWRKNYALETNYRKKG